MKSKFEFGPTVRYVLPISTAMIRPECKIRDINSHMAQTDNIYSRLLRERFSLEEEYEEVQREISKLTREIYKLRAEVREVTRSLARKEADEEFCERFRVTMESVDPEEFRTRSELVSRGNSELDNVKQSRLTIEKCVDSNSVKQLIIDVSNEWKSVAREKQRLEDLEAETKRVQDQISTYRDSDTHGLLDDQRRYIEELEEELRHYMQENTDLKNEIQSFNTEKELEDQEIHDLEIQLSQKLQILTEKQSEYSTLTTQQDKEREEIESFSEKLNKNTKTRAVDLGNQRRIFVGIFKQCITESRIKSLFHKFGPIESVKIITVKEKPLKFFANVQFYDPYDAESAIYSMNHKMTFNQKINVRWASQQPPELETADIIMAKQEYEKNKQEYARIRRSVDLRPAINRRLHRSNERSEKESTFDTEVFFSE